jgi:hypothetical protein
MQLRTTPCSLASCVSPAVRRTMLSKPLAYPSTLDHRPPDAQSGWPTSYVEGLWSPSLAHIVGNSQAKAEANDQPPFRPPCGRSLSPSGGASIRSRLSQAEHHLSVVWSVTSLKRRRRPVGSPSTGSECP